MSPNRTQDSEKSPYQAKAAASGIKAIARALGLAPSTVSRALNGVYGVKTETRALILEKAREIGYVPNLGAKQLVGQSSNLIGIFAPGFIGEASQGFVSMFPPLHAALHAHGKQALFFSIPFSDDQPGRFMECVLSRGLEGCVFLPGFSEQHYMIEEALASGVPCVHMGKALGPRCSAVSSDNREGGRLAGELLVQLGHRRIGYIQGPPHLRICKERYEGFCEALEVHGIAHDAGLVAVGDFSGESGAVAALRLWNAYGREDGMTAIFCANDLMAAGAVMKLAQEQVRIPADLSVIGYDDDQFAKYFNPPLSTIEHDTEPICPIAVRLLLEQLEGKEPRQEMLRPRLKERSSTCRLDARQAER